MSWFQSLGPSFIFYNCNPFFPLFLPSHHSFVLTSPPLFINRNWGEAMLIYVCLHDWHKSISQSRTHMHTAKINRTYICQRDWVLAAHFQHSEKSETRVTVPAMSLAFICSVAKWQGCCGLACTFTTAPAKMPATLVGELRWCVSLRAERWGGTQA